MSFKPYLHFMKLKMIHCILMELAVRPKVMVVFISVRGTIIYLRECFQIKTTNSYLLCRKRENFQRLCKGRCRAVIYTHFWKSESC